MQVLSSLVAIGLKLDAVESVQPYIIQKEHVSQHTIEGMFEFKFITLKVSVGVIVIQLSAPLNDSKIPSTLNLYV